MKTALKLSLISAIGTLALGLPAFAKTSTADLITKCQTSESREAALTELEKESGLNFNLESLSGDEALTNLVSDLQNRRLTDNAEKSAQNIRRILSIARAGVINAQKESLEKGLDKNAIEIESAVFTTMLDIFTPVLDLTDRAAKASGKLVSEADVMNLMTEVDNRAAASTKASQEMMDLQARIIKMKSEDRERTNAALDQHTLNIQKQTCLAAIKDVRK